MYTDITSTYYGLFSYGWGCTLENVRFYEPSITKSDSNNEEYMGVLLGYGATIGIIYNQPEDYDTLIVRNCHVAGGYSAESGLVGWMRNLLYGYEGTAVIEDCSNTATVERAGILGYGEYVTSIRNCVNQGDVLGNSNGSSRAGIVGELKGFGSIEYCLNEGEVQGAGIVRTLSTEGTYVCYFVIDRCVNTGNVTYAGIVGSASDFLKKDDEYVILRNCANYGDVTSTSIYQVV